ncbi:hypothetical protein KA005_05095 [bacterium]|nr:hypothetical protein [bacterium]
MAIVVGTNSYVTIAEADAYLNERIGASIWFALPDDASEGADSKTVYLASAYNWLLSSPTLDLPETSTDDAIKNAQIESAFYLLEHYNALNARRSAQAQGVVSMRLSKKWEEYADRDVSEIPNFISGGLSAYMTGNNVVELLGHYDE